MASPFRSESESQARASSSFSSLFLDVALDGFFHLSRELEWPGSTP